MGKTDLSHKKMEKLKTEAEDYKELSGWDAITAEFEKLYPTQKNPKHYGVLISWELGGSDPLRGISIYDGGDYWHFVTYGLSELYEKVTDDREISGYGMEFTFKLKKGDYRDEEGEIRCICGILQSIARITFTSGEIFLANEYLYTGQTQGIDTEMKSNITGFITIPENGVESINTANGKVDFVEFVGVTDSELKAIQANQLTVRELYERLGTDITSYSRSPVI